MVEMKDTLVQRFPQPAKISTESNCNLTLGRSDLSADQHSKSARFERKDSKRPLLLGNHTRSSQCNPSVRITSDGAKGSGKMNKSAYIWLGFCLVLASTGAVAQTVTGSGTSGTVPVFTGASTVGNSPISASGSSVGIGTTSPVGKVDVRMDSNPNTAIVIRNTTDQNPRLIFYRPSGIGSTSYPFYLEATGGGLFSIMSGPYAAIGSESVTPIVTFTSNGNMGVGMTPTVPFEVNGVVKFDSSLQMSSSGIYFSGSSTPQTTPWTGVLCGGDYAEAVEAAGSKKAYEPGDVLVITDGTDGDVMKSGEPYATTVAGIFATKPGVIGRREALPKDGEEVPMAMVGIAQQK
jgi:hypothetical protein